jgi:hypothetical protein
MIVKMADQGQARGPDGRRQRVPGVLGDVLSDCQADQGLIGAPGDVRQHGDGSKIVVLPFQHRTDRDLLTEVSVGCLERSAEEANGLDRAPQVAAGGYQPQQVPYLLA